MKIVIAPDSFKENLTSMEVATEIEAGLRRVWPKARCVKIPMADGGEGTVQFGEPPAGVMDVEAAAVLAFDVPLPRPGQYRFALSIDGDPAADVPLSASAAPAPGL